MTPAPPARSLRRIPVAVAVAAAALAATWGALGAGAGAVGAQPSGAPAPGSQYVALGDSYAAGYGIAPSTGRPVAGCGQSTKDYPHQVAAALHLKLTDASCSGAVTADIDQTGQDTGNGGGTAPRQDTALSARTKLVTVTIGGNDLGFASIAQYCLADTANGPLLLHPTEQNCKAHYDPNNVDSLAATVRDTVVPRVARVLADIRRKAPNAAVYFVDYPAISTTKADSPDPATYPDSCFSSALTGTNPPVAATQSFPFTGVDTEYLQVVQQDLDAQLKQQVLRSGDHFVESYPQSLAHSACTGTKDPWLNGITLDLTSTPPGTKAGSLHPNLEGADRLAAQTLAAIGTYVAPTPSASPTSSGGAAGTAGSSSPATAAATPLANSGYGGTLPMGALGSLLVVAGAALTVYARAGRRRAGHAR